METLNDVKKRIKSVQGIAQMTSAMQLVSAAKKRRAVAYLDDMMPFVRNCVDTMSDIRFNTETIDNPFFTLEQKVTGQTWKIAYFVIGGDQGLAGAYNNNIVKACEEHVRMKILENSAKGIITDYKLYVFGKVARERLIHLGYNVDPDFSFLSLSPLLSCERESVHSSSRSSLSRDSDLVYLVYTQA